MRSEQLTLTELAEWRRWVAHNVERADDPNTFNSQYIQEHILGSSSATTILNLNPDGSALTWKSARTGVYAAEWQQSRDNDWRRLFHTTKTCIARHRSDLPAGVKPSYLNPKVKEKAKSTDGIAFTDRRVRTVFGGNLLTPSGPTRCNVAETEVIKSFYNSVVSDNADYFTMDIGDFYLGTPLPPGEQVWANVPASNFSEAILDEFDLRQYIDNGIILLQFLKTIFGLGNAGILSKQRLDKILAARGYVEDELVPCIYRHATLNTTFCLVVDDFAVKHFGKAAKDHLIATLTDAAYVMKIDHTGSKFVGLTVDYNKQAGYIDISMPDYIPKILARFPHSHIKPCDSPMIYTPPDYKTAQDVTEPDASGTLTDEEFEMAQQFIGCCMWVSRMTNSPTLTAVSNLTTELAARRRSILPKIDRIIGHLKQFPDNKIRFHASDMLYIVFGDVSHNSVSKGRSRAGGLGFYGWANNLQRLNGAVFMMSSVLDVVTASAAEGEYGAAYMVARHAVWMRAIARALGHPQPPTTIWCDNTCAVGLCNDTLKTARTKSIDLRFHWLRDRVRQNQFVVKWVKSDDNIADFFTKALPVHQHLRRMDQLVQHRIKKSTATKQILRSHTWRNNTKIIRQ